MSDQGTPQFAENTDFDPEAYTHACFDCGDKYSSLVRPPEGVKFGSLFRHEDRPNDMLCLACFKKLQGGDVTIEDEQVIALRVVLGDDFDYAVRTLQRDPRLVNPHTIDITIRKDGVERTLEADWIKRLARVVANVSVPKLGEKAVES